MNAQARAGGQEESIVTEYVAALMLRCTILQRSSVGPFGSRHGSRREVDGINLPRPSRGENREVTVIAGRRTDSSLIYRNTARLDSFQVGQQFGITRKDPFSLCAEARAPLSKTGHLGRLARFNDCLLLQRHQRSRYSPSGQHGG